MKRFIVLISLIAGMSAALCAQTLTVAVSSFDARNGVTADVAEVVTELFTANLVATGNRLRVVDRNGFDKIIAEMKFQSSDWANSSRVAQLGKALNANSIIRGSVSALAGQIVMTAYILDINTAQILSASSVRMNDVGQIFNQTPALSNGVVTNLANLSNRSTTALGQYTVVISPFDIRGGLPPGDAGVLMDMFTTLVVINGAKVVDRNSFERIAREMQFQASDWSDGSRLAQLGRALNANAILRGSIMSLAGQTVITATILDINTAQILSSSTLQMGGVAETFTKLPDFVKDLELNMPGGKFVRIEGGTFQREGNNITISSFNLGKFEVTQKEWTAIMGSNPSTFKGDNLPVEQVTWFDAVEYCNKLSQNEGLTPAYTISDRTPAAGYPITAATVTWNRNANGYRLPTEAEWEYAARGGNGSPNNYTYAGSNTVDEVAWYDGNSGSRTHDVGTKKPNGLGLYDMSGNVWEWCWDWYETYASGAQNNPIGASSGSARVIRGGSWGNSAQGVRSALRYGYAPTNRDSALGFRVLRP